LSVNARGRKICVRGRLVWTGSNGRDSSRVGTDFEPRGGAGVPQSSGGLRLVTCGALHASALSLLRKHLSPENAAELFALCAHRSARKVEELLAARFPRPDVRDLVRRLTRFAIPGGVPAQAGLTLDVERTSEKFTSETMATAAPPREPTAPQQTAFVEFQPRYSIGTEPQPQASLPGSGSARRVPTRWSAV